MEPEIRAASAPLKSQGVRAENVLVETRLGQQWGTDLFYWPVALPTLFAESFSLLNFLVEAYLLAVPGV